MEGKPRMPESSAPRSVGTVTRATFNGQPIPVERRVLEYLAHHPYGFLLIATGEPIGDTDGVCSACGKSLSECTGEPPPDRD